MNSIYLHHIEPFSRANGPGVRTVVWFQGCTLACPGCFNLQTHVPHLGQKNNPVDIASQILLHKNEIEGVTISGGEPLQQPRALTDLLSGIKSASSLSTIVFTGYSWEEITKSGRTPEYLPFIDVLIAGRYIQTNRIAQGLRGSNNKTYHFLSNRYTHDDLAATPPAEILINMDGSISMTGIDPLSW